MTAQSHIGKSSKVELGGWIGIAVVVAAAVLGVWALITGPEARATLGRERSAEIAQETQDYCGKLGMGSGTQAFGTCAEVLAQVRRNSEERTHRYYGMF